MDKKSVLKRVVKESFAKAFIENVVKLDINEKDAIEVLNEHPLFNKNDIIKTASEKLQANESLSDNNMELGLLKEGENNKLRKLIKMLKG